MLVLTKPVLPYLETMLTYACTLSCANCTNYSDYGMKGGYIKWDTAKVWLEHWFSRMHIRTFGFIGGEPLLNPELETWIREFRKLYPATNLMLVTNAQLIMKNLWLLDTVKELGNITLKFSNHIPDADYFKQAVAEVNLRFEWTKINESSETSRYYCSKTRVEFQIVTQPYFLKTYKGNYGNMKPYTNDPIEAFKMCSQALCPLMFEGKLYKCSSLGVLNRALSDHNQIDDPDWEWHLTQYLDIGCSDDKLLAFINNYNKPNKICSMCPTEKDKAAFDHFSAVVNRINIV